MIVAFQFLRIHRVEFRSRQRQYTPLFIIVNTLGRGISKFLRLVWLWYISPMPTFNIPLLNIPRQRLTTSVNNQEIQLEIWFQPNDSHWYATVEHPVGTPLVSGRRIVLNAGLLAQYPKGTFTGDLVCRSIGDTPGEPGVEPWGRYP